MCILHGLLHHQYSNAFLNSILCSQGFAHELDRPLYLCFAARIRRKQHIGILEATGVCDAIPHELCVVSIFRADHLHLGADLGVELMVIKGPGSNFHMNIVCMRACASLLAVGSVFVHRWVASEMNRSDGPIRF